LFNVFIGVGLAQNPGPLPRYGASLRHLIFSVNRLAVKRPGDSTPFGNYSPCFAAAKPKNASCVRQGTTRLSALTWRKWLDYGDKADWAPQDFLWVRILSLWKGPGGRQLIWSAGSSVPLSDRTRLAGSKAAASRRTPKSQVFNVQQTAVAYAALNV
jgi:hypothetical protein